MSDTTFHRCKSCTTRLIGDAHVCGADVVECSDCGVKHCNGDLHRCILVVVMPDAASAKHRERDRSPSRVAHPTRHHHECGNGCRTKRVEPVRLRPGGYHTCTNDTVKRTCPKCKTCHYNGDAHQCERMQYVVVPDPRATAYALEHITLRNGDE